MATAIKKSLLGRCVICAVCAKYNYCQHQDTELRGDICWACLPFVALAEFFLRRADFTTSTEWDET